MEYDIGIYFEANGHGTTVRSPKLEFDLSEISSRLGQLEEAKLEEG